MIGEAGKQARLKLKGFLRPTGHSKYNNTYEIIKINQEGVIEVSCLRSAW